MPISKNNLEKSAVFTFGIIFLSIILVLVCFIPTPTFAQFFAFRLTMALSAAGIGALLPGFLRLDIPLSAKGGIRAGGALALFASVWFVNPATLGIDIQIPPREDAQIQIDEFLRLIDARDHKAAYALLPKKNREQLKEEDFVSMSMQVRDPLGNIQRRVLVSKSTPNQINGVQGPFVVHVYQSRFSENSNVWLEVVSTIPEEGAWRIYGYTINRCDPPFCQPIASLSP